MDEKIKIEMPTDSFDSYLKEISMMNSEGKELLIILDLIFDNVGFGIDKNHLSIDFPDEVMNYLKIVEKDRYNKKLEDLRKVA